LAAPAAALITALALHGDVSAQSEGASTVTYSREVSRILQANCQICHQPGQIGPIWPG
jgi:hypothetical protein